MGIRIHRNTWRAPLQLIDCWLPLPPAAPVRPRLPDIAQRFARAGWLGRGRHLSASVQEPHAGPCAVAGVGTPPDGQAARARTDGPKLARSDRSDARIVLSGRVSDVCAELERLAALELRWQPASH